MGKRKRRLDPERLRDPLAQPGGMVLGPGGLIVHASTAILCKDIAAKLVGMFPGWNWAIQPDERGGIINVFNLDLHDQWAYTIRMVDIQNDPNRREAIRAGGEILERFGLPRMGKRNDLLLRVVRDSRGQAVPDAFDRMTRQDQEQVRINEAAAEMQDEVTRLMEESIHEG